MSFSLTFLIKEHDADDKAAWVANDNNEVEEEEEEETDDGMMVMMITW